MLPRETIEHALKAHGHVVSKAALHLGMHPSTLAYQVRRLGLYVPRPTLVPDQHQTATVLTAELASLRAKARAIGHAYLPGPHKSATLRALEARQLILLAQLRGALGEQPVAWGTRRPTTWDLWR